MVIDIHQIEARLKKSKLWQAKIKAEFGEEYERLPDRSYGLVSSDLKFIGVAEYVLNNDSDKFRYYLERSAGFGLMMCKAFESNSKILDSRMSMKLFNHVLTALAATNIDLAKNISKFMGERPQIEEKYDNNYSRSLGYLIRDFVLDNEDSLYARSEEFRIACKEGNMQDFIAISDIICGISLNDRVQMESGFNEFNLGYERQCKPNGIFYSTAEAILNIWAIAFAYFAHHKGILMSEIAIGLPSKLYMS